MSTPNRIASIAMETCRMYCAKGHKSLLYLVGTFVHYRAPEESSSAVEDRADAANKTEELVVADEGLTKGLVESQYTVRHQDH